MAEAIKGSDVIDPNFLVDAIQQAKDFLQVNKDLTTVLKENLAITSGKLSNIKVNNSADLKQQAFLTSEAAKELKNLEVLERAAAQTKIALQKVEQERIRTNRELAKSELEYNRQLVKNTKDVQVATTAYDSLRKKYNDLSRAQIELDARGRSNGIVFRGIKEEASNLRLELDRVEQGAGRFQRNVGNYTNSFNGLGNSVNQITREFPAFAVSMNTGFLAISNNLPIFFDQLQKINAENAALVKSGKPVQSALSQLGGAVFSLGSLLSVGVTLLTLFGSKIVSAVGEILTQNTALTANVEALKEQKKALDDSIQGQIDLTEATAQNNIEILKQNKKIDDFQAKNINAYITYSNKTLDIEKRKKTAALAIVAKQSEDELIILSEKNDDIRAKNMFFGKESLTRNEQVIRDLLAQNNVQYDRELRDLGVFLESELEKNKTSELEKDKVSKKSKKEKIKDLIDLTDRIVKQNILNESDTKQRAISLAEFEGRLAIKEVSRLNATYKQKQLLILAIQQDTVNKLIVIDEDYTKKEQEIINNKFAEKDAINDRNIKATHKVIEDNRDFELYILEQNYNDEKAKGENANKTELKRLNQLILDKKALLIQARADEEKDGKTDFEKTAIQNKADIDIKKLKLDNAKKDSDDIDKKNAEELKKQLEFSTKIIDAIAKAEAEKSRLRVDAFDRSIKDQEKNIETQRNLANRGLTNTLAEEEARKIQLERQKEEEKLQEIKRQKALAFFKLFASYAEKDPDTALENALRDTIIAEGVAAAFIDGTENVGQDAQFKGNKFKNGTDGYIAKFDGDERIINPEQNKLIGNLSNEALANLAYNHNNGLLDNAKYGVIQSSDFSSNIANSALLMATMQTNKRLESLELAIVNKPVTQFAFDQYGDFIKDTIEGGFTKRTTYKQDKIRI